MYSDEDLEAALESGTLVVERPDDTPPHIEPSSIDLHFANELYVPKHQPGPIQVDDAETFPRFEHRKSLEIQPREFALASTTEWVSISPELVGILHGRSSVGRLGLFVENAGLVDAGFDGTLTLELFNAGQNAITLVEDMRIAQLTIHEHDSAASAPYSSATNKYQAQHGPTPSRLHEDFA